ncbi:unnamed protein product [Gadus morhua 'NCC']
MFCLDVVQIFGLQPQVEGRLLPLLSQRFGHLQELPIGQSLPCGAGFSDAAWKKDKDNPHTGSSSFTYRDDGPIKKYTFLILS